MDVVQWLVPLSSRKDVAVCFAPAWADRLPKTAGLPALRRRSAPLVTKHLVRPLAVAVAVDVADDEAPTSLPGAPGQVALRIHLSAEGAPLLPADADDVRFAALLGEFVGVVVDVAEAAGVPVMGVMPTDERRALQILLGGLQENPRSRLADAFLLFAGAIETCALARGFSARCSLVVEPRVVAIDADIEASL